MNGSTPLCVLLDYDPDLYRLIDRETAAVARQRAVAATRVIPAGAWEPADRATARGFGALLLDGALVRRVTLGDSTASEILGPGDIFDPTAQHASGILAEQVTWRALHKCRIAVLDTEFAYRIAPWPTLGVELAARSRRRALHAGLQLAITNHRRVEQRLLALLLHFAERWGRVTPDGLRLDLPLTHALLGELIGAQRPSVTTVLARLSRSGHVEHLPDGWLIRHWQQPDPNTEHPAARLADNPLPW